jgi:hypothetical protein
MERNHRKEYLARKAKIAAGTVGKKAGRPENTPEELWKKVEKREPEQCWSWLGYVSESGYGRTQIGDKSYYAHRVIFNLANPGLIELNSPKNKKERGFLMHLCDNRLCCNPAHLRVADLKENNEDCIKKGRKIMPKGQDHFRSVFTNEEINQALQMKRSGLTAKQIALAMQKKYATIKSLLYRNRDTFNA